MRKNIFFQLLFPCIIVYSCNKQFSAESPAPQSLFTTYTIKKGQHFTGQEKVVPVNTNALRFVVRFDSSCIYTTTIANNQHDINKLYGFSDNNAVHHAFSARFGWRWYKNELTLQAYIYNDSMVQSKNIAPIDIGKEYNCAILVEDSNYTFTIDTSSLQMPRTSKTASAIGYKLFPYFGGDETAPHDINIYIKDLP